MYIHVSLSFKSPRELDSNTKNLESPSIELISKIQKTSFCQQSIGLPSQKSKPRFNWEKARFNQDEYNFNGINRDLSEILS